MMLFFVNSFLQKKSDLATNLVYRFFNMFNMKPVSLSYRLFCHFVINYLYLAEFEIKNQIVLFQIRNN